MKFSFRSKSCPHCKKKDSLRKFSFGYSEGKDYYCMNANCDYITSFNMEYEKAKQDYLTFGENNSEIFKFYEYNNEKDGSSINFYSHKSKVDDPPTLPLSCDDSVQNHILCPNCSNQLIPFEHCYAYSPYDTTFEHRCSSCDYTTLMVGRNSIVKELTEKPIKQKVDVAQKINEIRKEFDNNIIGHKVIKETILDIMNHQLR